MKNIRLIKILKRIFPSPIKKQIESLVWFFFRKTAIEKLREDVSECKTLDDYVNLAFSFEFSLFNLFSFNIKPSQVRKEIFSLLKILAKSPPHALLEIGTTRGGTLFLFSQIVPKDATLISIDLSGGRFGGGYPKWKIPLYKAFAKKRQKLYLIRADSHSQKTLEEVKKILDNQKIDFLFIDGDHSYEGVKKDFEMYSNLVKQGRIIAFHDIVKHPIKTGCEVSRFWNQIKKEFKYKEIVKDWKQGWAGIGILYF